MKTAAATHSRLLTLRLSGLAISIMPLILPAMAHGAEATLRVANGELLLKTPGWTLALDAAKGAIHRLEDCQATGTLLRGDSRLWVIQRHKSGDIASSDCTLKHAWDAADAALTLEFDGPDAAVQIVCRAMPEGPAWQAAVTMKHGTMIGWRFPMVEFDVAGMDEFVLPENLGLAFSRSFFEPGNAGMGRHPLGPAGLEQVAHDRCQMRPVRDPAVAVRPGRDGSGWLPEWYLKELPRWQVTANRCPAGSKHDLSLVETEHGCWLSGYQLGGWGWLFRVGGILRKEDSRPVVASVIATLSQLYRTPPTARSGGAVPTEFSGQPPSRWPAPPRRIGIVTATPAARPGVRLADNPKRWLTDLGQQAWVRQAGIEVVLLRDAAELRQALAESRRWFALVNTLGEGLPAEGPDQVRTMLGAVRQYVRNGGIWWETGGGYSFHYGVVPSSEMAFRTGNRDFCDFAALRASAGQWSLCGVQSPEELFVPAQAEIRAYGPVDARRGSYEHTFQAFASPGKSRQLPQQQMVIGQPHRQALAEYARRNGFTRGLADKAKPEVIDALKRSILLKVSTRKLSETVQIAQQLPFPVLFHIADYLRGGFDKQYPDHLPPNPAAGTAEDLSRLVQVCRSRGHLFMPYTNPTWWCVNPKGPTFEVQGEAPLSRDLDDKIYPESYGLSTIQGYAICAWHPAVQAANDITRRQFTEDFPAAVLFEDQVGARGHRWDTNPAAPHAGAYLEGIHRIAHRDGVSIPLGTEDGHDRLINWETMFCGLSAPWLPNRPSKQFVLYEDLWPEGSWRIEPLALLLAHDKVLFYHHDLGGFVRNRRDLSLTLVMGYGLSWWTHSTTPSDAERDWLERLCRLQAAIGPRCVGRALDQFEYLTPQVIRSRWGDLEIVANLSSKPWPVEAGDAIAPEGFHAKSPDMEAGIFQRPADKDEAAQSRWTIRVRGSGSWSAGPEAEGR